MNPQDESRTHPRCRPDQETDIRTSTSHDRPRNRLGAGAVLALALVLAAGTLLAAGVARADEPTHTWAGTLAAIDDAWSIETNWQDDDVPGNGDTGAVILFPAIDDLRPRTVQYDMGAQTYASVTLDAGGYAIRPSAPAADVLTLGSLASTTGANTISVPLALTDDPLAVAVGDEAGELTLSGAIRNAPGSDGGLTKTGAGSLRLTGTATHTGTTTLEAGTLVVGANVDASSSAFEVNDGTLRGTGTLGSLSAAGGTIDPGSSTGVLTVDGDVALGASATLAIELAGTTPGTGHDQLAAAGDVDLGGATLEVAVTDTLALDDTFEIVTSGAPVTRTFAGLAEGAEFAAGAGDHQVHLAISYQAGGDGGGAVVLTVVAADPIVRLGGADRIETAIEVSQHAWDDGGAEAVVLARSDHFADGLAGSPLAVAEDGPLLITGSAGLDDRVADELERVLPAGRTVYLLGGEAALSAAVADGVTAAGYEVVRYGGADRYETAVIIARDGLGDPGTILLATGLDFPDALAGAAAASHVGGAVLLTAGSQPAAATSEYLAEGSGLTLYALGGWARDAHPEAQPLVGVDRFHTAVLVSTTFFDAPAVVGIAVGTAFPDALSGGAHVGRESGPVLLTRTDSLPERTNQHLGANASSIELAYLYGGAAAISPSTAEAIRDALAPSG